MRDSSDIGTMADLAGRRVSVGPRGSGTELVAKRVLAVLDLDGWRQPLTQHLDIRVAARALADHYDQVTIVERDALPEFDEPRKGVPQGRHTHGLLARGREVLEALWDGGLRADLDDSDKRMGARIREAQLMKIPFALVIGDREVEGGTVAVRERGGADHGALSVDDFVGLVRARSASELDV